MQDKKIKNIALLLASVLPLKVLIHYLIYTDTYNTYTCFKVLRGNEKCPPAYQRITGTSDLPLSDHINAIFTDEVWLFIPILLFALFIGWYFGLFDLKRIGKSNFSSSKVIPKPEPHSKQEYQTKGKKEENGEVKNGQNNSKKSKRKLTYIDRSGENGEIETEMERVSSIMGLGDKFYEMDDWGQIKTLVETFKKAKEDSNSEAEKKRCDKMFGFWLSSELRFADYSFAEEFKLSLAEQIVRFYNNIITIKELKTFFDENVIWKEKSKPNNFYQLTEQNITLYKNDQLLGDGKCYGIFENWWSEEVEDFERGEDKFFIIVNNKILVEGKDYKYDDIVWGEDNEILKSEDKSKIEKMYNDFKSYYS